jgi:hypothetical protein
MVLLQPGLMHCWKPSVVLEGSCRQAINIICRIHFAISVWLMAGLHQPLEKLCIACCHGTTMCSDSIWRKAPAAQLGLL